MPWLNDYGTEVVSVLAQFSEQDAALATGLNVYGLLVGSFLTGLSGSSDLLATAGKTLYFPPGRYVLEAAANGAPRSYVCPAGVQLFFAVDAILRLEDGVDLIIHGTIRAGNHQIFGFSPDETILTRAGGDPVVVPTDVNRWPVYEGAGRVFIESDTMPLVRPEWWGASTVEANSQVPSVPNTRSYDSSDAFQGAIEAACVQRHGRPPIPIVISGIYVFARTVEVRPVGLGLLNPVCLVIRGNVGVSDGNQGVASIFRVHVRDTPRVVGQGGVRGAEGRGYGAGFFG